jgi:hypothetical protein
MSFTKHCDLCDNISISLKEGYICKIDNRKPAFVNECSKILLDEKFQKKLEIANLELEIINRNKTLFYYRFYSALFIGLLMIIAGLFFLKELNRSVILLYLKLSIIGTGLIFVGIAYAKRNRFKNEKRKATSNKIDIDDTLKKYRISYHSSFDFKEKIHGIQEVIVNLEFKNWAKTSTSTSYKIND